ncbi:MAG: helix-turn-helix transcriptional regulator, partial [Candidatus Omnitrophota bacterium]
YAYNIVKGIRPLNKVDLLQKYAKALNVTVAFLLGEESMLICERPIFIATKSRFHKSAIIGNNLRFFRKEMGLSVNEFGALFNLSGNYITRIEEGRHIPSQKTLVEICKVLKKDIGELFYILWDKLT